MKKFSDFGNRLQSERERLCLTQAEMANLCGVKPASQYLYERGDRTPNAEYLMKASTIGIDTEFLLDAKKVPDASSTNHSINELRKLFVECDHKSRDEMGRLLDLDNRASIFISLFLKTIEDKNHDI